MIESSVGNYKILEQLNDTETLKIYKAVDTMLNRNVHIKVLNGEFINRSDIAESFRCEAAILAKLVHPGIPTLHSLTTVDQRLFMIMEFLDGETLDKTLLRHGKLSSENAISIFTRVLDSLEYAHSAGITHGNLKTDRIFLTDTNSIKILGFGTSAKLQINQSDNILPEKTFDAGADIYEVGKMFFKALTGENLPSDNTQEIEFRLRAVKPAIPDGIVEVITNIFRLQAYGQFQSAGELRRKLLSFDLDDNLTKDSPASPVYSLDFSRDENKTFKNAFRRRRLKARGESKSDTDTQLNWKLAQKNFWVAGAGVLAIVVLHFFFQVSSIQTEVAQVEKGLTENKQAVSAKPLSETERITEPDSSAKTDPFVKQFDENSVENSVDAPEVKYENRIESKAKKSVSARNAEVISPPVQSRPKFASPRIIIRKKEPQQQTRAERLRRAEKILTGA